jgi:prolyl-tRNA editing enzyme YbaK/EbsC (Cys-tRNA(Pro) deacylase)
MITLTTPLLEELDRLEIGYELILHPHTESAEAEAEAVGTHAREVVKTLVLVTPTGFVRAVLPAYERLDLYKVRRALGSSKVHLASEVELAGAYPQFELGAVPPIGGPDDPVIVDESVADFDWAIVEAGTHDESVRIHAGQLLAAAGALIASIVEE